MSAASEQYVEHRNEVTLVGKVASEPQSITLPSGDELVSVRIVVQRPPGPAGRGRRAPVDALVCAAWTLPTRRRVRMWDANDIVEIRGALRRRFWRTEDGSKSRYEVEITEASRLRRGTPPQAGGTVRPEFSDI